jgi:hypothetical protein
VDEGAVPAFISSRLRQVAAGVGVRVADTDTPQEVIEKVRQAIARRDGPAGADAAEDSEVL